MILRESPAHKCKNNYNITITAADSRKGDDKPLGPMKTKNLVVATHSVNDNSTCTGLIHCAYLSVLSLK
jgi:hypothetical protein